MDGIRNQDDHLYGYLARPINDSPAKSEGRNKQIVVSSRTPVLAHEVRFMRQRLEGEEMKTREVHDAILALDRLHKQMEIGAKRVAAATRAVVGGR